MTKMFKFKKMMANSQKKKYKKLTMSTSKRKKNSMMKSLKNPFHTITFGDPSSV